MADLTQRFAVFHYSVEVTVRGQITKDNQNRIKAFVFRCCDTPGKLAGKLVKDSSKAALLASFSIFCARKEPSWLDPAPLLITLFSFYKDPVYKDIRLGFCQKLRTS